MTEYEKYEKECEKIQAENGQLLELFRDDLQGLSEKTINRHVENVDFYINDYMLREDARDYTDGPYMIDGFLGDFFIRKCMWSTPGNVKTTAVSIKKFYRCMLRHGKIAQEAYDDLCETIKENMEEWQSTCAMYNDPDAEDPFNMFGMFDIF